MDITTNKITKLNQEIIERFRKDANPMLTVMGTMAAIHGAIISMKMEQNGVRMEPLRTVARRWNEKRCRQTKSNNWLKMHGYPMRSKVQLRKIHQNQRKNKKNA